MNKSKNKVLEYIIGKKIIKQYFFLPQGCSMFYGNYQIIAAIHEAQSLTFWGKNTRNW